MLSKNKGKRSGVLFIWRVRRITLYILMNWNDRFGSIVPHWCMRWVTVFTVNFTLATNQPYVLYGDYSIFLAEIASTTNENILTEYMLETGN